MTTLLKFENVWKIYKLGEIELPVIKGVDFEIKEGSFTTIMGPSGSGKSTLMYLLGFLDKPTKGKIYFKGQDISSFNENELALLRGKKIGFIFQQFNLLAYLSAIENVMLPMIFQGYSEKERFERAKKLLESLGLGHRLNHKPLEMSGGEQQRVAIARALANEPDILIADEPTGNLDSSTGKKVMEILTNLHKNGKKTIIVVTHDPFIAHYGKNIIHIRDGQIVSNHFKEKEVLWQENSF